MNVKIMPMFPIKLIRFESEFNFDNSYQEIPKYWDEICEKHCKRIYDGEDPVTPEEHAIVDNCIGEYALCIDGDFVIVKCSLISQIYVIIGTKIKRNGRINEEF